MLKTFSVFCSLLEGWGEACSWGAATLPAYKQTEPKALWCARRGSRRSSFSCLSLWPTATKEQPRHQAGRAASNEKTSLAAFQQFRWEQSQKLFFCCCFLLRLFCVHKIFVNYHNQETSTQPLRVPSFTHPTSFSTQKVLDLNICKA